MASNINAPTDLQALLQADVSGAYTRELLAMVERALSLVAGRTHGELVSFELRAAEQLCSACDAADRVLRTVWESLHGRALD